MNVDEHGWGQVVMRMDSSAGAGDYRAKWKEKRKKKKTYLINWASTWLSIDVQGGSSGH